MRLALAVAVIAVLGAPPSANASSTAVPPPVHTWTGIQANEGYGWAVSELGDVDGDHAADAIIGAPFYSSGAGPNAGHVDVRSTRTGDVLNSYFGQAGDYLGYAIADAGDVDGDGVHDVVIGAPQGGLSCTGDETGSGLVQIRSGATGALLLTADGSDLRGHFGAAVASAGDVNGDGHADVLVGAPCANANGAQSGAAYVISGTTGKTLLSIPGRAAGDHFGIGTGALGDVNGDGVPDSVVGAADAGAGARGVVYAVSGRDGSVIRQMTGDPTTMDLGWFFVAGVGDVNGDGVPDIYAGDFDAGAHQSFRGRSFVFSGATGKKLDVFTGATLNAGAGPGRSAGDVDGDGVNDIAVGSYTDSAGAANAGRVDIYSGRTGRLIRTYISTVANEEFGFDAVGVGDVTGDGRPELLVSAANNDTVYVLPSDG